MVHTQTVWTVLSHSHDVTYEVETPLGHHGGISLQMSLPDGGASLFIPQGHSKDGAKTHKCKNHTTLQTVNLWL